MKLTFSFTDQPEIADLKSDYIFNSHFEIPDEAQHLIGWEERVLEIANHVGKLTGASLHLSCKELNLKYHPIKLETQTEGHKALYRNINSSVLYFERQSPRRNRTRQLKILAPDSTLIPEYFLRIVRGYSRKKRRSLRTSLIKSWSWKSQSEANQSYIDTLTTLSNQLLILLNAEPANNPMDRWDCRGYHPFWTDNTLITRHNNRMKKEAAEERKRQRLQEKLEKRKTASDTPIPTTGAGRRYGAIPGIFKGIQFRSQLEIRFATELESRGIKWVYETERLGDGNYLVDFYLPEFKAWIEVKGRFEPRDEYLLKSVADYLKQEREERLFVYTQQGKCYKVNATRFSPIERKNFWQRLIS